MGGRSSSSSAATTTNQDNRVAVQDGIGLSASSGNVVQITDAGIVSRGLDTVDATIDKAIKSINLTGANQNEGFTALLNTNADSFEMLMGAAESLWAKGEKMLTTTQQTLQQAYTSAEADKDGSIDQRTIIVLAIAGAATLAIVAATKGRKS